MEQLLQDFLCPVCIEEGKQLVISQCCHIICKDCAKPMVDSNKNCPMCRAALKIAPEQANVVLNNIYAKIVKTLGIKPGSNKMISSAEQFKSMETRMQELTQTTEAMQKEMTRAFTRASQLEADLQKERLRNEELEKANLEVVKQVSALEQQNRDLRNRLQMAKLTQQFNIANGLEEEPSDSAYQSSSEYPNPFNQEAKPHQQSSHAQHQKPSNSGDFLMKPNPYSANQRQPVSASSLLDLPAYRRDSGADGGYGSSFGSSLVDDPIRARTGQIYSGVAEVPSQRIESRPAAIRKPEAGDGLEKEELASKIKMQMKLTRRYNLD